MSNNAIFLDRDGTLIEDPGYLNSPKQVKLLDGTADALAEFREMGYKLVVVTNQSAVARGIVTEKVLDKIHDRLKELLAENAIRLDGIYYCPYHPNGSISKYCKQSNDRKPNPGMLLRVADEMDIDLSQSWLIGDSPSDIEAGLRAGCKTILVNHLSGSKSPDYIEVEPDYKAVNMKEAVNIVKKHHRSSTITGMNKPKAESQFIEQADQPSKPEPDQPNPAKGTEQLLTSILAQLKTMQRENMFGEFSAMRLIAGIVQIVVLFCLLVTIWFLMSPARHDNAVLISLGFAILLQLMSLTFYIMHEPR